MPRYTLYTVLPELVVTPAPWQIDYKNNFGSKELRDEIRDNLKDILVTEYKNRINNEKSNKLDELHNKYFTNYDRSVGYKYVDEAKAIYNHYNAIYNKYDDKDVTDETERLYNIWLTAGRPTMSNDKSIIVNTLSNEYRPSYNSITNNIYRVNNLHHTLEELAHPIQMKYGKNTGLLNNIKSGLKTLYYEAQRKQNHYRDKSHYEYETHSVIAPELKNYVLYGTPTKYIPISNNKRNMNKK